MEARHSAECHDDHTMSLRAWKLFLLLPYMLLRNPRGAGRVGKDELSCRLTLLEDARRATQTERPLCPSNRTPERRAHEACQKVRLGEVSRARQCLTGAALAPGNEDTFRALQDRRPQQVIRPLTQEVLNFEPEVPVHMFLTSLKSAPRGSSPGPGGCTYEHSMELLFAACTSLAQSRVPSEVVPAIMGARLTALAKPDGGVRGIATGSSVRRLVARTLAKQFTKVFQSECAPFQYALSTRAGTDCIGHMVRAATDNDPSLTLLSVDGIGSYDHIFRSSMLGRLLEMPRARALLPFVRMSYAQPSQCSWVDEEGRHRIINQAEGGEQGDPLMPLLFSIGIQQALEEVAWCQANNSLSSTIFTCFANQQG